MSKAPVLITLYPAFQNPELVQAGEATPKQLYDAWDAWRLHKVKYGLGPSEDAMHARNAANTQIRRIKKELRIRRLPMDRLLWEQREEHTHES